MTRRTLAQLEIGMSSYANDDALSHWAMSHALTKPFELCVRTRARRINYVSKPCAIHVESSHAQKYKLTKDFDNVLVDASQLKHAILPASPMSKRA